MYCKNCGNYIEKGQSVCPNCGSKKITTRKIIKRVVLTFVISVLLIVSFIVARFVYINNKYSDGDNIKKLLVGSSGNVLDENNHLNDIYIESEQQIVNTYVYSRNLNEFVALIDIDIGVGYLRNVQVTFRVPILGFQHVKANYDFSQMKYKANTGEESINSNNYTAFEYQLRDELTDKNNYTAFQYKVDPPFTGKDIMNYIGVHDAYNIMEIGVTSIANTYDSFEYSVLWKYQNDIQMHQDWVRAEYDYENRQWTLKEPTEEKDNLLFSVRKKSGNFEIDADYNPNDIVYIDLEGAEIE